MIHFCYFPILYLYVSTKNIKTVKTIFINLGRISFSLGVGMDNSAGHVHNYVVYGGRDGREI